MLRGYVEELGRQLDASETGLLARERYSSDIPDEVLGLHSQATVVAGAAGDGARVGARPARRSSRAAARRSRRGSRPGSAARSARSQRRLADGSLFVPARLLDGERPYDSLTQARLGSYWNLVDARTRSRPGSSRRAARRRPGRSATCCATAPGLPGVVRAGAYALYARPGLPDLRHRSGLRDQRRPASSPTTTTPTSSCSASTARSATAMTPNTFVSGEAASVAPLGGSYYRSMYLPPNGASNAAFLETLRSLLVHETRDAGGAPHGLELAFATPRPWLRAGRRIAVERAPTSFGPVSYSLEARSGHDSRDGGRAASGRPRSR